MPRPTFHQLPAEKRERVQAAAIAEFAEHDYTEANLDRIAEAASVSKGSLYQYFRDKEECFAFSVRIAIERAAALFEASLERDPPGDCFELFERALLFVLELRDGQRPLALLYVRAGFVTGSAPSGLALPMLHELAGAFHERLLDWGIAAGAIDAGIDRPAAGFLVDALATRFHAKVLIADPQYGLSSARPTELARFAGHLTQLLRRALSPASPSPQEE
jgi:AcrR family transcriptional regulator